MRKVVVVNHAATRQDLLAAAAQVFAERGFRDATIREICRRAKANVAAVTYHFGGKAGLYAEVLAEGQRLKRRHLELSAVTAAAAAGNAGNPEVQLARFVRAMLTELLTEAPDSYHNQLMFREMIAPTAALDRVVSESIRPTATELDVILQKLLGKGFGVGSRRLIGLSIVSQILNYKHCHAVITRLFPDLTVDASQIEVLAEHITRFSMAALRGLRLDQAAPVPLSTKQSPTRTRPPSKGRVGTVSPAAAAVFRTRF